MKHTDIKVVFQDYSSFIENTVVVCGWVRTSRDSKNVGFVEINDGTCVKNLQVVIDRTLFPDVKASAIFPVGTGVMVSGKLVKSKKNICELILEKYEILGISPSDYPLQKKRHSL